MARRISGAKYGMYYVEGVNCKMHETKTHYKEEIMQDKFNILSTWLILLTPLKNPMKNKCKIITLVCRVSNTETVFLV
jgi:hypothetical protein